MTNLQLLLDGPFVLCEEKETMCIWVPDLLDSHYKPGFSTNVEEVELENGGYSLLMGRKPGGKTQVSGPVLIDEVNAKPPENPDAYLTLQVPKPDEIWPTAPVAATPYDRLGNAGKSGDYGTKLILRYLAVDLNSVEVKGTQAWHPTIMLIGAEWLLTFDMQPTQRSNVDHARMVSRAKARMVGITHYICYEEPSDKRREPHTHRGPHNDCHAVQMLVR